MKHRINKILDFYPYIDHRGCLVVDCLDGDNSESDFEFEIVFDDLIQTYKDFNTTWGGSEFKIGEDLRIFRTKVYHLLYNLDEMINTGEY